MEDERVLSNSPPPEQLLSVTSIGPQQFKATDVGADSSGSEIACGNFVQMHTIPTLMGALPQTLPIINRTTPALVPASVPSASLATVAYSSIDLNTTGNHGVDTKGMNISKKRNRSAPWTVMEMLALIDAKRAERQRSLSYKIQGMKLTASEKWRLVARNMQSKDMDRSGSQCQDKWENMMKEYKAVREWQCFGNGTKNYFKDMTNKERKDARLPPQMDEIIFYKLQAIHKEKEEQRQKVQVQKNKDLSSLISETGCNMQDLEGASNNTDLNLFVGLKDSVTMKYNLQCNDASASSEKPMLRNNFPSKGKEDSAELHDVLMKALERSKRARQEAAEPEKETATLVQVLVALADAVKTVAQKL